jgi:Ca2+-binding RTX toxin-like protein
LNIWAPAADWPAAFNGSLKPAADSAHNTKYLFDVTSFRVDQLSSTYGTNSADTLKGTSLKDWIVGGEGNDTIDGNGKADRIIGGQGDDTLNGGGGRDTVSGGSGNDLIHGQSGNDDLRGRDGEDTFFFETTPNVGGNVDKIRDFEPGVDRIALSKAIFTAIGGALASGEFHIGKDAEDSNDRIIYDAKTGKLSYDDDGAGGHAEVEIALLNKHLDLHASDFVIIG